MSIFSKDKEKEVVVRKKAPILISDDTRKYLLRKKIDMGFRSIDEVINYLIEFEKDRVNKS